MSRGLSIRVDGVQEAIAGLGRAELRKRGALSIAVQKTALGATADMKRLLSTPGRGRTYGGHTASAPGAPPAVDTGRYRASWRHRATGTLGAEVYSDVAYGPHLEFGTRRMAARPHVGPVAEMTAGRFRKNAKEALGA